MNINKIKDMKKTLLILSFLIFAAAAFSQNAIPNLVIKTLDGKDFNASEINSYTHPVVLSFWATWCGPCLKDMDAFSDVYEDWKEELGVEFISVAIDDAKTAKRIKPLVEGRGWEFTFLTDENQDLKRALGISYPPHILVIKNGKILYQHSGFAPGIEDDVYDILKQNAN
jgi:thiol-disulfide isomerase/thioredoxin